VRDQSLSCTSEPETGRLSLEKRKWSLTHEKQETDPRKRRKGSARDQGASEGKSRPQKGTERRRTNQSRAATKEAQRAWRGVTAETKQDHLKGMCRLQQSGVGKKPQKKAETGGSTFKEGKSKSSRPIKSTNRRQGADVSVQGEEKARSRIATLNRCEVRDENNKGGSIEGYRGSRVKTKDGK